MGIPRCSSRGQTQSPGATRLTRKDHLGGFISVSRKGHFLDMVLELTLVDSGGPSTTSEMAKKTSGMGSMLLLLGLYYYFFFLFDSA